MKRTAVAAASIPKKRVLLMIGMAHAHGRSVLEGIADYADHHTRWLHRLEVEPRAEPMFAGDVDGMIVEPDWQTVEPYLKDVKVPVITVTHTPVPGGPPAVVVDNQA